MLCTGVSQAEQLMFGVEPACPSSVCCISSSFSPPVGFARNDQVDTDWARENVRHHALMKTFEKHIHYLPVARVPLLTS
jgi:hypothetical protein